MVQITKKLLDKSTNDWHFFTRWMRDPKTVGAVVPSSRGLARLIVSGLSPQVDKVVELGGGTGVFTREILRCGIAPENLIVFEIDPSMAQRLSSQFPHIRIVNDRAEAIHAHTENVEGGIDTVISGLPLVSMKKQQQMKILSRSFSAIKEDGGFYQFTYAPVCPVNCEVMKRLSLKAKKIGVVWRNCPPATVFQFQRA